MKFFRKELFLLIKEMNVMVKVSVDAISDKKSVFNRILQ